MQTFEQVKDVVEYSKHIHDCLKQLYQAYRKLSQSEPVSMMLDYLISEQQRMKDILSDFEQTNQQDSLATWMQYAPSLDIHSLIANRDIKANISLDELVDLVDEYGKALVTFYQEAANESELPKVTKMFENLAEMETKNNTKILTASESII